MSLGGNAALFPTRSPCRVVVVPWAEVRAARCVCHARKGVSMLSRLGALGILALVFAAGCFVASLYQQSWLPAIVGIPGAIYVLVRLFRTADA